LLFMGYLLQHSPYGEQKNLTRSFIPLMYAAVPSVAAPGINVPVVHAHCYLFPDYSVNANQAGLSSYRQDRMET